jgi:hypothetical protein
MHQGKYVFAQVMACVARYEFNQCVAQHGGMHRVRRFSCWEQFLALSFGQLTYRESLRDIVVCLDAHHDRLYHLGIRSPIVLSTIARANERRDWRMWSALAQTLIARARPLYVEDNTFTLDLDGAVYLVDATTIDLCLSVFPWAHFRTTKSAVKLSLQLDVRGNIPTFFDISKGNVHDVHFLDKIDYERGAYYVIDRGYTDFARLYIIDHASAYFVIRAKKNLAFRRVYSRSVDKTTGVRCDQIIRLIGVNTADAYRKHLRRIVYIDAEMDQRYVFLTNDLTTDAYTIATLYKYRWQVELFFKWIKQHLKIKAFWGHSANAVKTQLCIAICTYLLVAIMKKHWNLDRSLYEILQILSVTPFEKIPLDQLFSERGLHNLNGDAKKQLILLDF